MRRLYPTAKPDACPLIVTILTKIGRSRVSIRLTGGFPPFILFLPLGNVLNAIDPYLQLHH